MDESRFGQASLAEIQVDEQHWGKGAEPIVKEWLARNYDPGKMPTLQVAQREGREGMWLLGWDAKGTSYPPLLELIFGRGYARQQLEQIDALIRESAPGERCPRCRINRYTPYGQTRGPDDPPPPALSRTDNETHICSSCGTDEALEDFQGMLIPKERWPIILRGSFGQGRA